MVVRTGFVALLFSTSLVAAVPVETPRVVRATLLANPGKSVVYGTVVDARTNPVAAATVRLRNLQTHTIEQVATTSGTGEFAFPALPDVSYVVELVDRPGHVIVVGDIVAAHAGEFSTSLLVLPASVAGADLFHTSAGSIVLAIVGAGMTVLEAPAPPLSPELPPLSPEK